MKKKDRSIEALRGLAVMLVIGLHITNDAQIAQAQDFYSYIAYTFHEIRIPLFTVISGFLYGLRPVSVGKFSSFFQGKVRRIFVPLLVVASCEFTAKSLLPGVNEPESLENLWKVWIFGYHHFWFLQSIFLIFVLMGVLGHKGMIISLRNWSILFLVSGFLYLVFPFTGLELHFFSLGAATRIFPFFMLGIGLACYHKILLRGPCLLALLAVFVLCLAYQQLSWFTDYVDVSGRRPFSAFLLSISACALLFKFRIPVWGVATVGSYAYTIYLFQGFGMPVARIIVTDVGPHWYFIFVIGITVAFGIVVEHAAMRIPYCSTLFLGLKPSPIKTRSEASVAVTSLHDIDFKKNLPPDSKP